MRVRVNLEKLEISLTRYREITTSLFGEKDFQKQFALALKQRSFVRNKL